MKEDIAVIKSQLSSVVGTSALDRAMANLILDIEERLARLEKLVGKVPQIDTTSIVG